jgi:hypothetical protein
MSGDLSALALIAEEISATGGFSVWMFWRRNRARNEEQQEDLFLNERDACEAAAHWISGYHYEVTGYDPEDGWEPPRTPLDINDWFNTLDDYAGGIGPLVVRL